MSAQGWDRADYQCGTCGHTFTATSEQDYFIRLSWHQNAHALVSMLTPEIREQVRALLELDND